MWTLSYLFLREGVKRRRQILRRLRLIRPDVALKSILECFFRTSAESFSYSLVQRCSNTIKTAQRLIEDLHMVPIFKEFCIFSEEKHFTEKPQEASLLRCTFNADFNICREQTNERLFKGISRFISQTTAKAMKVIRTKRLLYETTTLEV